MMDVNNHFRLSVNFRIERLSCIIVVLFKYLGLFKWVSDSCFNFHNISITLHAHFNTLRDFLIWSRNTVSVHKLLLVLSADAFSWLLKWFRSVSFIYNRVLCVRMFWKFQLFADHRVNLNALMRRIQLWTCRKRRLKYLVYQWLLL